MPQTGTKRKEEEFTAAASVDRTPRVAIVPSDFKGSEEHDGSRIDGLAKPQPAGAELRPEQLHDFIGTAFQHIGKRANTQPRLFGPDEWVLVMTDASFPPALAEAVVAYLAQHRLGLRFTIPNGLPLDHLRTRFPKQQFDTANLSEEPVVKMPAPRNQTQVIEVPQTLQQCDRVVSLAGWGSDGSTLRNYALFARDKANWLDLARFHPPDLALAGSLKPNLLVVGSGALSVDAVAAAIANKPFGWAAQASKLGLGVADTDAIWTRGIEVEDARKLLHL